MKKENKTKADDKATAPEAVAKVEKEEKEILVNQDKVGSLIHEARLKKGLKIADASKDLCIRASYLEAIEAGNYDEIPETALGMLTVSNASGLVSLTNIKVTGMDEFDIGYSQDLEEGDIDAQTLYLLPSNYSFTDDAGEETPDEPTVFEPERFEVHVNYAKLTKKATVNAATSKDVAYITINGERVDPGVAGDTYSFALSFKKVAKGTTYEVIAYNADGAASESIIAVAE